MFLKRKDISNRKFQIRLQKLYYSFVMFRILAFNLVSPHDETSVACCCLLQLNRPYKDTSAVFL